MHKIVNFIGLSIVLILSIEWYYYNPYSSEIHLNNWNSNSISQNDLFTIRVPENVRIKNYFQFIDSLVIKYDSLTPFPLTEHLLVRSNPWIIDTLRRTDYYYMKSKDSFVYDQKEMIVLPKFNELKIPDSILARNLLNTFKNTYIDINIPEFKLRIIEDSIEHFNFNIRVGQNKMRFLEMSGRMEDLRTKTGEGYIINHVRNPRYINPVNNHEYFVTRRDDNKVTKLPQIPFIEPEINGLRHGQLIHPTTNPATLGKAYSNGCIGTKEGDAWAIYYYAPLETRVIIRYDLTHITKKGDTLQFKDIYN